MFELCTGSLIRTRSSGFGIRCGRPREWQHKGRTTCNTGNRASMPNLLVWVFTHTHTHTHTHTERDVCLASENIDFGHQERSRQEINCVEVVCIARKIISAALTIVSYSDSIGIGKGN